MSLKDNDQVMRLVSLSTLLASFVDVKPNPDPCEPQAHGGYLGADNQLIRVQISGFDKATNQWKFTWGYDNASFLYRVAVADDLQTLRLLSRPVDDFHKPRANQAVEVLPSAAQLSAITNDYIASMTGPVATLTTPYVSDTQSITLPAPLPAEYKDTSKTPVVFLRVWEEELPFTPGTAVPLGTTGLQVTLQTTNNGPFHIGDYWLIAVRPNTAADPDAATEIFPHRYLERPQSPDGPRLWACPLAVIQWNPNHIFKLLEDCRNQCDNLTTLTARKSGGCCDVTVKPEDITENNTLQTIIDKFKNQNKVTICLMPGVYNLPASLLLGPEHSNLTLEGCHDGVVIQAEAGKEKNCLQGLIVLNRANNVTLRGLRFELPQVPFGAAAGRIANLEPAALTHIVGTQLRDLRVSIGVRPLHCALLTIKDCLFRFSLTQDQDVFGVGIFAGSECWGLTVQNNRFVREEDFLRMRDNPFRLLIGYLLSPTTLFKTGRSATAAGTVPAGSLIRSLLQDASFQDNVFAGLSVATLIYADAGVVKFERNTVRDCHAGFWLLSLRSLAFAVFLDEVSVNKEFIAFAQQLRNSILATVLDPIIQIGSVIARGYPLPKEFDVSQAIQIGAQKVSTTAAEEHAQIQALFNKALSLLRQEANAPAGEKVNLKESVTTPTDTTFTSGTGLGRFNALHLHLSDFERAALIQKESQRGLHLSLHVSDNDIDALISNVTSGIALLVWDDERDTESMMTMSANKIRNRALPTAREGLSSPTGFILMVERCAITGNLILNEERAETAEVVSLFLVPGMLRQVAEVAVTGNVLRGRSNLSQLSRPGVPSPLDTWQFLNTEI